MENKFSIGILTWKSHDTLRNTLESYKKNGLLELCDDVILFAQEGDAQDFAIAQEYGIASVIGSSDNIGIGKAFNRLFKEAKHDKVMILENDWVLVEDKESTEKVINESIAALESGQVDFIRLRHVKHPGDPLYTWQFAGNEMKSPEHLLDAIHWLGEGLKDKFPDKVSQGDGFLVTDSEFGNHTNNPFMCSKEFYTNNIEPYTGKGIELEGKIRESWRSSNYLVGHSTTGLFTHNRIDR